MDELLALAALLPEGAEPRRMAEELRDVPAVADRFNAAFTGQGWVFVEFACGYREAEEALRLRVAGRPDDEIDAYLADHFLGVDPIYNQSLKLLGGGIAEPRHPVRAEVVERAFQAYRDGDYLVCVPLVLMLIDGFGMSKSGTKSIFADLAELDHLFEDEESVGGHPSGLKAVLKRMVVSKKGYSEKPLTVPERNGILHGTRLNFATKIVAAKALNVLAAVVEWARDTDPEPKDEAARKKWNINFLSRNLARLEADTPDRALELFVEACREGKAPDAVALLDYHPVHTTMAAKIRDWAEMFETYEIGIRRLSPWEIFGRPSDSEQQARCKVELSLKAVEDGRTSITEETLFASRPKALADAGLPSHWQLSSSFQGCIRARLPVEPKVRDVR
jgi:hypothetical protein